MSENQSVTLADRSAAAIVSAVAAGLTLLLLPIGMIIFVGSAAAKGAGIIYLYYTYVFSKTGLLITSSAAIAGFLLGPERIATVFSFFWFTHPCWQRLSNFLDDRIENLQLERSPPRWLLLCMLLALWFIFIWVVIHKFY